MNPMATHPARVSPLAVDVMPRRRLYAALATLLPATSWGAALEPAVASGPEPGVGAASGAAADVYFNPGLLHGRINEVDLSRFEKGQSTLPGTYRTRILVNGDPLLTQDVTFRTVPGQAGAQACITPGLLSQMGLDPVKVALHTKDHPDTVPMPSGNFEACGDLHRYLPDARVEFDSYELVLRVSIPQVFLRTSARGYVNPDQWDHGVPVATLAYNANTYHLRGHGQTSTSTYVGVQAGVNAGRWRFRHDGAFNHQSGSHQYRGNQTYVQRDVTAAKAQLTLGDTYTNGELVDSLRIRGVTLGSDTRMLAPSQRGFAPVIRGVAETNARVTVKQRGYVIYETTVAAGGFQIDDLYPSGFNGDLEVTITEADGREKYIRIPFSAQPRLLREGQYRFNIAVGELRELSQSTSPMVVQGTLQYGVSNALTLYGGITGSKDYRSVMTGAAINTRLGALSMDVTDAHARLPRQGKREHGISARLAYAKRVASTDTTFGLAAYRCNTRGYLGIADAARLNQRGSVPWGDRERSRFDVSLQQSLGSMSGQLSLGASQIRYWNGRAARLDYSVGYSHTWRHIGLNVQAQRSQYGNASSAGARQERKPDNSVFVSINVPLGHAANSPRFHSSVSRRSRSSDTYQAGINGTLGADNAFSYGVQGHRSGGAQPVTGGSANATYRSPLAVLAASVGKSSRSPSQYSLSASGAVVAHRHGVTLGQELGETNAIVHAPGARGARVDSRSGVRIDRWGNAIVPHLNPYQVNSIDIDPIGTDADVEMQSTNALVVPRAGAVVQLNYTTVQGKAVMVHALHADGSPLPFGALVFDAEGNEVGVVGQGSRAFIRGAPEGAVLKVSWGQQAGESCRIRLPPSVSSLPADGAYRSWEARCELSESAPFSQPDPPPFSLR
ncbi:MULTISPECIES: fimbria/pilus outer membrane usher protein [Dyella]|uniref:Fimbrial biogenesis outer membrane usher protein n=2 Tax=Dyella TaxID=231454 RepID=A0A4R0YHU4_9GAMM|nr:MULTISPECIES: fimbria/pilus outer membrane usher protein [Dyella]TBR36907.1 fimbrial biogenesis outer membrane usher protein [Dyella terrae]TCI08002.1 fimbrial biogenesis outer membrane usher protein [Dyella soli]